MSKQARHSNHVTLGQMWMATLQSVPPVNCIFRIREGGDINDHDDVEDDG